jgi:para-aminobenzoate synthetase component I
VKRTFTSYPINDFNTFKTQLLNFVPKFSNFCFLDNHQYEFDKSYECIAAAGSIASVVTTEDRSLTALSRFQKENDDWVFGHLSYDIKNEIEQLTSQNFDGIQFPGMFFFVPEIVFILSPQSVSIGMHAGHSDKIFNDILSQVPANKKQQISSFKSRFPQPQYLEAVRELQQHIIRGDCYEICFCQEFFAENILIDPVKVFQKLSKLSPNPFAALYKYNDRYLMCASPERFLKKIKNTIISQPIKGTSKREGSIQADEQERSALQLDAKERAENIMIVDLVRNDLSKICTEGSVSVKEYLKIYSFPQVHQMISTITGTLRDHIAFGEILAATFPMGSMTGAPKKRAMELIEQYEKTKRGLFSGTVGYIDPEGNFDFNVIIRSILYNESNQYLSIQAGSAITFKSDAQKEFEECQLKVEVLKQAIL